MFVSVSSSGEFGSVMEGLLTQEEFVLKVAVKTMKSERAVRSAVSSVSLNVSPVNRFCSSCHLHALRDGGLPARSRLHEGVRPSQRHEAAG